MKQSKVAASAGVVIDPAGSSNAASTSDTLKPLILSVVELMFPNFSRQFDISCGTGGFGASVFFGFFVALGAFVALGGSTSGGSNDPQTPSSGAVQLTRPAQGNQSHLLSRIFVGHGIGPCDAKGL